MTGEPIGENEIQVSAKWVEAKVTGNINCPTCGKLMLIFVYWSRGYAYCLHCNKYWIEIKE